MSVSRLECDTDCQSQWMSLHDTDSDILSESETGDSGVTADTATATRPLCLSVPVALVSLTLCLSL